jgi:membrane protease YdiL (CAAX protease family)
VAWLGKELTGRPWSDVLPVQAPGPAASLLVATAVAGLQVANLALRVSNADRLPRGTAGVSGPLAEAPALKAVVIAPVTEEAMLRGLILGGFLLVYRRWTAILLAAALFAAIHLDPVQAAMAFGPGVLLSWIMAESRKLALPLLGHATGNAVAVGVLPRPGLAEPLMLHRVTFGILGLFVLALGTGLLRRALRPVPRPSLTMVAP